MPEPVLGLDEDFDHANDTVDKNKEAIIDYVTDIQNKLKCSEAEISLSTASKKFRYEV